MPKETRTVFIGGDDSIEIDTKFEGLVITIAVPNTENMELKDLYYDRPDIVWGIATTSERETIKGLNGKKFPDNYKTRGGELLRNELEKHRFSFEGIESVPTDNDVSEQSFAIGRLGEASGERIGMMTVLTLRPGIPASGNKVI